MSRPDVGIHAPGRNPEGPEPGVALECLGPPAAPERWGHKVQPERGAGTGLALGLGMLVIAAAVLTVLLAQSAAMAFRAAAAADLAALAAADAARGITPGEPCAVAADVARRNGARILSCLEGPGSTVQVRTELDIRTPLGGATGLARAGPPP